MDSKKTEERTYLNDSWALEPISSTVSKVMRANWGKNTTAELGHRKAFYGM